MMIHWPPPPEVEAILKANGFNSVKFTWCSGDPGEAVDEVWRNPEVLKWLFEQTQTPSPRR